jgi:hypothetical protein
MFDLPVDVPSNLQEYAPKQAIVFFAQSARTYSFFSTLGGIIKLPGKEDYQVYAQLPCPEAERAKIVDLITTIGTKGKLDLLLNHKSRLEKMGNEIDEKVHPLKFLAVIFSNPQLKSYMANVRGDYFKWSNFLGGFSKKLNFEHKKGKIVKFFDDFALEVNVSSEDLRYYYEKKDWEGFLDYLINH